MDDNREAIATPLWPVDMRLTSTLQGRDALEQIRGASVDPAHAQRVDAALSVLLAHRADCGFYPGRVPGLEWMQLVGFIERRNSALGRPPNRMATRWVREWR
jgi:hypothetical protein